MNVISRNLRLGVAALLCAAAASGTYAAEESVAVAGDAQQVQELDQIMVRGTRVREAIANAEDEFFALYNTLNKDDDYSASCVFIPLGDTQIRSHICIPGFMADALADQVYFADQCRTLGGDQAAAACYTPPPPQAVLSDRAKPYANHLLKVIRSDDRLGRMAGNLDDLYHELGSIQQRYMELKSARSPVQGPRVQ
jgi:hypothetical protein